MSPLFLLLLPLAVPNTGPLSQTTSNLHSPNNTVNRSCTKYPHRFNISFSIPYWLRLASCPFVRQRDTIARSSVKSLVIPRLDGPIVWHMRKIARIHIQRYACLLRVVPDRPHIRPWRDWTNVIEYQYKPDKFNRFIFASGASLRFSPTERCPYTPWHTPIRRQSDLSGR